MKKISIFIASSSELKSERNELVDLIQDLNEEYENKNIKLKAVLWEFMDSSMGEARKEDEYLEKLRECEICVVMFWQTLGEYTEEELKVAVTEMNTGKLPKRVYVLFKEPCENISKELTKFKLSFPEKYPHIPVLYFHDLELLREITTNLLSPKRECVQ